MDKKRLLLLGGGHAEIPLIKAAQALGYYVITTGNAREGLGHPFADKNVFEDFSNKDAMLELARRERVDAVCSGCNDFALLSTVYVCEKLGLPGHDSYETSLQIHHKDKYRALAERLNIPTPRAVSVRNRTEFDALLGSQGIASPSARNDIQTERNGVQCHSGEQDGLPRHSTEFDALLGSQGIASPSARNDIQTMRNDVQCHSGEQDGLPRHSTEFDALLGSQGIASPSARNDIQTMRNDVQCHSGEQDGLPRHSTEFDALLGSQGIASPSARNDIQTERNGVQCHSGEQDGLPRHSTEFDALLGSQGIASPSARNDIQTMRNDVQCHSGEQDGLPRHSTEFDALLGSQGIASPSARNDIQTERNGVQCHSGEQDGLPRHSTEFDALFGSQGIASPSARNDIQTMRNDVQCHSGEQDGLPRHSTEFDALFGSQGIASPSARNDIQTMRNGVQCHSGEQDGLPRHSTEFDALLGSQGIASPSARNDIQTERNDVQCHSGEQDGLPRHCGEQDGLPRHCEELCDEAISLTFPVIVKPIDLTGGKGIHRAANYEEAVAAYEDAVSRTREDHVVVEEFVTGTNHGFSAMLVKGKVAFYFADNEQYFVNKYMVSGASTPSTTSNRGLQLLCEYSERIAAELKLVDGILHIQYIERDDGIPVIIEICRRPPGDLYIRFVQYATGVNYPRAIILAETGKLQINDLTPASAVPALNAGALSADACEVSAAAADETFDAADVACSAKSMPKVKPFLRHCVMASREGTVQGVSFANEIADNVVEKFLWYKKGEPTGDILYYKAGIVFLQFDTVQEMLEKTARMTDLIQVSIA